jgi:DNA-3-methyladenine glycosylase II
MPLHTHHATLTPVAPFDFGKTLAFLSDFAPAMGEHVITTGSLAKALSIDGQPVVFQLDNRGTVDAPELACTLMSEAALSDETRERAIDRIRHFLSLDDDLTTLYALAQDDPYFAPVVRQLYGYHQVKFPSAFENAVWAILSQRNRMPLPARMMRALLHEYGTTLDVDGVTFRAFPEAERLAIAGAGELARVIGHGPKGTLLLGVAQAFDGVDERWLRDLSYDEAKRWLKRIHGIGEWMSTFVLLRGLGKVERLPRGEPRLPATIARAYGQIGATDEDVARLGARYGDQIGYWAHYLRVAE